MAFQPPAFSQDSLTERVHGSTTYPIKQHKETSQRLQPDLCTLELLVTTTSHSKLELTSRCN